MASYPEGATGNVDFAPGDDDGMFDGFGGNVDTEVGAVAIVSDLDVDGEAVCILVRNPQIESFLLHGDDKMATSSGRF